MSLLLPEISLVVFAFIVIVFDLLNKKAVLPWLSVAGVVVAAIFAIAMWGLNTTSFAGMLFVDSFSIFFKYLFLVVALLIILSSRDYVPKFARFQGEYYALVLLSSAGMMLMAATGELISIYIALELTSISLYILASFLKDTRSSEAGLKYLLLGAISSAMLLYGMALVYGLTGSTHLGNIAAAITTRGVTGDPALLLGIVFMVAGFGFKIAAVPFQMWVPDVYEGSPTPVVAYLSVASKAAGFAVILRVFYGAFGPPLSISLDWALLFAVLAAVSMTVGNVVALVQGNIKRMMGYSSIAQAGYLMVGLATLSVLGRSGLVFFLASYAVTNLGAFFAIIAISNKTNSDQIEDFAGIARRSPWLAAVLALCLISLIGLPPTAGFIAKVYLFSAAVQDGLLWLVIIAVINSVISAFYYLRVVKVMYLGTPASEERVPSSGAMRFALGVSGLAVLFIGVLPGYILQLAQAVAKVFPS
ncbi:MAG: NADH-quinone oxidoreductase subunit N [Chloroflexi bacterium]|nr:NADH-quinone oxidoreductase subunit N [Chloroflexota bacterium]